MASSRYSTTGGVQRFKAGHHGAEHSLGAMIGYIQEETTKVWDERVKGWINDIVTAGLPGWTDKDQLQAMQTDAINKLAQLESSHERGNNLPEIQLRHLWIEMN